MSDRIMVMNRGKVEQIGAPSIFTATRAPFRGRFYRPGEHHTGQSPLRGGRGSLRLLPDIRVSVRAVKDASFVPGDEAAVVVRPENLRPPQGTG